MNTAFVANLKGNWFSTGLREHARSCNNIIVNGSLKGF